MNIDTAYILISSFYYYFKWYFIIFLPVVIYIHLKGGFPDPRKEFAEFGLTLRALFVASVIRYITSLLPSHEIVDISKLNVFLQLLLILLIQDIYFFFTHYLLHRNKVFNLIHKTHHNQKNVTPYTTYSLSIVEVIIQFGFYQVLSVFIYNTASDLFTIFAFSWSLFLHTDIRFKYLNRISHVFVTNRYHIAHHREYKTNYGLYLVIWDKLFGSFSIGDEVEKKRVS